MMLNLSLLYFCLILGGALAAVAEKNDEKKAWSNSAATAASRRRSFKPLFLADVALRKIDNNNRHLQAKCVFADESQTSLVCYIENDPAPGFVQVFQCPLDGDTTGDCDSCTVVAADSADAITADAATCNSCSICPDLVAYDCSNLYLNQDICAAIECDGLCINESNLTVSCSAAEDGTDQTCLAQDPEFLNGTFVVEFSACPSVGSLFDCGGCTIIESDTLDGVDDTSPRCASCSVCNGTLAFNCESLLSPDEPCSIQDCDGTCLNVPPPTMAPSTGPPSPNPTLGSPTTPMPTIPTGTLPPASAGSQKSRFGVDMATVLVVVACSLSLAVVGV